MAKKAKFTATVVVDTREQLPYLFPGFKVEEATLDAGDYSIKGMENEIVIERKTKADIYQSVTQGRERFEREMVRLGMVKYRAIVIESTLDGLLKAPAFSRVPPSVVVNTLVSWSIKYGVAVWLAGTRELANRLTFRLLEKAWQAKGEQNSGKD